MIGNPDDPREIKRAIAEEKEWLEARDVLECEFDCTDPTDEELDRWIEDGVHEPHDADAEPTT